MLNNAKKDHGAKQDCKTQKAGAYSSWRYKFIQNILDYSITYILRRRKRQLRNQRSRRKHPAFKAWGN